MKVFLGGTCGESTWREELIPILKSSGVDYVDPVVRGRKRVAADQSKEIKERESCDLVLYCITPDIRGVYSIAEVIDDSNKRPKKTLYFFFDETEDKKYPLKGMDFSLKEVGQMVRRNGGTWFDTYEDMVEYFKTLNERVEKERIKEALAYTE